MHRIVLASSSPRRRMLLGKITDSFEVVSSDVDERSIEEEIMKSCSSLSRPAAADKLCRALARCKAFDVYEKLGRPANTVVIGADTSVALSDEILGKPSDRNDAVRMLRKESLEPQKVVTGVCIIADGKEEVFSEFSSVYFKPLDDAQEARIQMYCDSDEPYDKAGAYGIQDGADALVAGFEGSYDNIVGFPSETMKIKLEKYLK